ncbi:hypothetical protein [Gordonia hongkongensis]|uniref:ATP dependent DNA ligase n=1 Tax=Gordonia hongkongensis TaxID=1701090 RepID=UPI003BAEC677
MAGMAPMLATPGSPPSGAGWAWEKPVLVGTVEYREFDRRLRHPSWKGSRTDKTANEAIWDGLGRQHLSD